ncbi:hypothetical protein GCM10009654_47090 [Streptomyces hebeiensis]|uniref:Uncharacterized protein n=1 Tax=Streptomyces hebeiensis TaxID=229486 RepID=A0ABN1V2J0_9ACTN
MGGVDGAARFGRLGRVCLLMAHEIPFGSASLSVPGGPVWPPRDGGDVGPRRQPMTGRPAKRSSRFPRIPPVDSSGLIPRTHACPGILGAMTTLDERLDGTYRGAAA